MSDTPAVGVLLPFIDGDYFSRILAGIGDVVLARGLELLAVQGTPAELHATGLARERVSGWIAVLFAEGLAAIAPAGTPIVTVACTAPGAAYPAVVADNRGGFAAAVRHLCRHGHRRIAFVGCLGQDDMQQRFLGYQDALAEAGIPLDPQLVYEVASHDEDAGRAAAQRMLAAEITFTAVAVTTDSTAIAMGELLQAAGQRIPEDIAVVSFNDIPRAQHARPPLSTVQQRPDEIGRAAAALLLGMLAGDAPPQTTTIPTALVIRRSCGCDVAADAGPPDTSAELALGWEQALELQLARLARYPLPIPADTRPADIWPDVAVLAGGLAAAAAGRPPSAASVERAWQQAVAVTPDLANLNAMLSALHRAADAHLGAEPTARARVDAFLDGARLALLHARLELERTQAAAFASTASGNHALSMRLLGAEMHAIPELGWLAQTDVSGACLGLWGHTAAGAAGRLTLAGSYVREGGSSARRGSSCPAAQFPPADALPSAGIAGDITLVLPVRSAAREWGYLVLRTPARDTQLAENRLTWASLLGVALDRTALVDSLTEQQGALREQQETLRAAYERERALADTIRELGSPVIPLLPKVLLVPLIGAIGTDRAQQIVEGVLEGVHRHHAHTVLLDVTGVPLVDTQVAGAMVRVAQAAGLLGSQVVMVGMRPEMAQSIVALGIELRNIVAQPSLAAALQQFLARTARR